MALKRKGKEKNKERIENKMRKQPLWRHWVKRAALKINLLKHRLWRLETHKIRTDRKGFPFTPPGPDYIESQRGKEHKREEGKRKHLNEKTQ